MARESWRTRPLVLEMARRMLVLDGRRAELPIKEFELLAALAARPGEAVSAKELIDRVWPESSLMTSHDLYWYVWSLRKLIGDGDRERKLIANRRGVGYYLDLSTDDVEILEKGRALLEEERVQERPEPTQRGPEEPRPTTPAARAPNAQRAANETVLTAPPRKQRLVALVTAASTGMLAISWFGGYWLSQQAGSPLEPETVVNTPLPSASESNPRLGYKTDRSNNKPQRPRSNSKKTKGTNQGSTAFDDAGGGANVVTGGGTLITTSGDTSPTESSESSPNSGGDSADPKPDSPKDGSSDRPTRPAKDEPKEPPPPPQPSAVLYHLFNPKSEDHYVTTSSSVSNQKRAYGYRSSSEGRVFTSQEEGTVAISLSDGTAYIYKDAASAPTGDNVAALYKVTGEGESYYTSNPSEASQAQARGWSHSTVGYVGT